MIKYIPKDYAYLDHDNMTEVVHNEGGYQQHRLKYNVFVLPMCESSIVSNPWTRELMDHYPEIRRQANDTIRLNGDFTYGSFQMKAIFTRYPHWDWLKIACFPVRVDKRDLNQYDYIQHGLKRLHDRYKDPGDNGRTSDSILVHIAMLSDGVDEKTVLKIVKDELGDLDNTIYIVADVPVAT